MFISRYTTAQSFSYSSVQWKNHTSLFVVVPKQVTQPMKRSVLVLLTAVLVVFILVSTVIIQTNEHTNHHFHLTDIHIFVNAFVVTPRNNRPWSGGGRRQLPKQQQTKLVLAERSVTTNKGFGKSSNDGKQGELSYILDNSIELQKLKQFLSSSNNSPIQADLNNVEVGFDKMTGRRGLYATKNIGASDKIICKIPTDFLLALGNPNINENNSYDTVIEGDDDENKKEQNAIVQSALYYLNTYINDPSMYQQWESYLRTIPNKIDVVSATPDLYDNDMIQLLEFPKIVKSAMHRKHAIQQAISSGTNNGNLSIEQLQYATWLVSTRSFTIPRADPKNNNGNSNDDTIEYDDRGQVLVSNNNKKMNFLRVLVPYLDIVNHSSPKNSNARWTILDPNKDDAWFALESTRPIKVGKEITISYGGSIVTGSGTTIDLLLNYGFVNESMNTNYNDKNENQVHWNPIDTVMLKKGGKDCYTSINQWTTTIQEDQSMLQMMMSSSSSSDNEDSTPPTDLYLQKILQFRIQMKNAYQQLQ